MAVAQRFKAEEPMAGCPAKSRGFVGDRNSPLTRGFSKSGFAAVRRNLPPQSLQGIQDASISVKWPTWGARRQGRGRVVG